MDLDEYHRKRDFRKTPEPRVRSRPKKGRRSGLAFVIQKHAARRLHFDFRLELDGVMKSWAVPKGPSLDPAEKRLAVAVEDHPLDYADFEGVIPRGEYGGGTVLLWDRGTWTPIDPDPIAAYAVGKLKFALHGARLQGNWMLVRMTGKRAGARGQNWLLVKERDEAAAPGSGDAVVGANPLSVESGRSIEMIANDRDRVWVSPTDPPAPSENAAATRSWKPQIPGARKAALPDAVKLQLATAASKPPEGSGWLHEIKYDGYRLLARIEDGKIRLMTRNGLEWTAKFPELVQALLALGVRTALIDGELVALALDGTTNFARLQAAIAGGKTAALTFYAFDLLHRDGWDLTGVPLEDRKAQLSEIIPPQARGMLRFSDHQIGHGAAFAQQARRYAVEGIVSKRRGTPYQPGRGRSWLKVKFRHREEFAVIGFTEPERRVAGFGALLLGYYDPHGVLHYAGRVGSGFTGAQLADLSERLAGIPSANPPGLPKGAFKRGDHWVEPRLVAEIEFAGWTAEGVVRQASFLGLREDKSAREVVRDPDPVVKLPAGPHLSSTAPERSRDGSVLFEGVRLTHPDRVLYPDFGLTKRDLAQYYAAVHDHALAHLAHRPLTLLRSRGGTGRKGFYQRHVAIGMPDVIRRLPVSGETAPVPVIDDLGGLVALVQIRTIEIHPWGAKADRLETPDRVTFDLDPDEGLPWPRVTEAAIGLREALLGIGLQSFVKTTGGKGLHVVVPLVPKLGWDAIEVFSKWVAERLSAEAPGQFTANQKKTARQGRIYVDYQRNRRGATAVGAYSSRAYPGAPVSTPVSWAEVENGVRPEAFTVVSVPARLAGLAVDPWGEIGRLRQSLSAGVRRRIGI